MFWNPTEEKPLVIQAYDTPTNSWYSKSFTSKEKFTEFVLSQWKDEPQLYKISNTKKWKEVGQYYTDTVTRPNFEGGRYHDFATNSLKHNKWKETEKDKILNGVIFDGVYIPPFYYWYLNFCPIYDDVLKKRRFADVWDGDLWYMIHVMICLLTGKHVGGVKGRQKGYSFKHMSILYWCYSWFEGSVNTVGAYTEDLVKKSWRFLEGYRNHINHNTTWKRGPTLPKSLEWHESQLDELNRPQGLGSKLTGVTFKQRADNDVGGSQTIFNYEEPGVSPTILETLEFMRPALQKGSLTTGIIIACGSVGKLDDAEGLKEIFYKPRDYNFRAIKNVWDKDPVDPECGIFISEAYNMIGVDNDPDDPLATGRPFMDKDGNSDVELALDWIRRQQEKTKKSQKKSELKQLAASQKCTSPSQAFDQRSVSFFQAEKMKKQQERIKHKAENNLWDFVPQKGLMEEKDGKVVLNPKHGPEHEYPIKPNWEDKRGCWTLYQPIPENAEMYMFFAGVDPIEADETETSKSVASVDIYQNVIEVSYTDTDGKVKTRIEGDKLAATYRGRFDTAEATNEQIWLGIKAFNAFTFAERNKPNFINYMKRHGRAERYLAKESDVPLFKDLNMKSGLSENNSKYGFYTGDNKEIWKLFKSQAKEYFGTEYSRQTFEKDGIEETLHIFTGIDRTDDYWLLEEYIRFVDGKGNYDRLVSNMAAIFICKIYQQNRIIKKRNEVKKEENYQPRQREPINLLGGGSYRQSYNPRKQKPRSIL